MSEQLNEIGQSLADLRRSLERLQNYCRHLEARQDYLLERLMSHERAHQ